MKILLASQVPSLFELKNNTNQPFPSFQAQTFWIRAIKSLGHQVRVFKYSQPILFPKRLSAHISHSLSRHSPKLFSKYRQFKNKYYQFQPENYLRTQKFISMIAQFKPEILLMSGGISHLHGTSLEYAKLKGVWTILLHGENPSISATRFETDNIDLFDQIITNDPTHAQSWKNMGAKSSVALPYSGIDPSVHRKIPKNQIPSRFKADVVFVGTLTKDRQKTLIHVTKLNINFKILGYIPERLDKALAPHYLGQAWGKQSVLAYNGAKIAINLVPSHMPQGGNMRTFEIPGSGAFQLASRCRPDWFFPNQEIAIFGSNSSLITQITHYLKYSNKRSNIAENAYKKTHRLFTYKKRFKKIFQIAKNND